MTQADVDDVVALTGRLSAALANLLRGNEEAGLPAPPAGSPELQPAMIVSIILARRALRRRFFPEELFADPAWDMLLFLFEAQLLGRPESAASTCQMSGVPMGTALRWLRSLEQMGLVVTTTGQQEQQPSMIELSVKALQAMTAYFEAAPPWPKLS